MLAPVAMVTLAVPDCSESSALMATICTASGDGAAPGAVYVPLASMVPRRSRGARRALDLPHHALIAGSQHGCRECLHRERRKRHRRWQHGHQHAINHGDLRRGAPGGVGYAGGLHGDGIRSGNRAWGLTVMVMVLGLGGLTGAV